MVITEILARNARMYRDEVALIEREPAKNRRVAITWKEFDNMANRVANALLAKGIKKGKKVKQGDIIAYVGATGLVTGPHLDFRFYRNGKAIDPLKVKSPSVKPVDFLYRNKFDSVITEYVKLFLE